MDSRFDELLNQMDLVPLIAIIYRNEQKFLDYQLKDLDINSGQISCLMEIYSHGDVSDDNRLCQKDLVDILKLSKSTISNSLSKLEDNGYIVRKPVPNNKRKYMIYLTDKGKKIIPKIIKIDKIWEDEMNCDFINNDLKFKLRKIAVRSWNLSKNL